MRRAAAQQVESPKDRLTAQPTAQPTVSQHTVSQHTVLDGWMGTWPLPWLAAWWRVAWRRVGGEPALRAIHASPTPAAPLQTPPAEPSTAALAALGKKRARFYFWFFLYDRVHRYSQYTYGELFSSFTTYGTVVPYEGFTPEYLTVGIERDISYLIKI